jgi:hypothetical protein
MTMTRKKQRSASAPSAAAMHRVVNVFPDSEQTRLDDHLASLLSTMSGRGTIKAEEPMLGFAPSSRAGGFVSKQQINTRAETGASTFQQRHQCLLLDQPSKHRGRIESWPFPFFGEQTRANHNGW